jgi:TrpR family transcriptional regulator, trp operon repressor
MTKAPIREIAGIFARSRDEAFIADFLRQILTADESKAVALRWSLVRMLHEGVPQREIARRLGVSLCKITRGSRELKRKDGAFSRILRAEEKTHG